MDDNIVKSKLVESVTENEVDYSHCECVPVRKTIAI